MTDIEAHITGWQAGWRRVRGMGLLALLAVLALGLVACGEEESGDGEDTDTTTTESTNTDDVPNASVTPLPPEAEGTGVPRLQDDTPTEDGGTLTPEAPTEVSEGEVHEVIIGDDLVIEDMTIAAGDTVRWTNENDTTHTITSTGEQGWASDEPMNAEIATDEAVTHQFTTAGEYPLMLDDGEVTWTVTVE